MAGTLLLRGMLTGLLAALIAFGFARFYAEQPIAQAISFEEGHQQPHQHEHADAGISAGMPDHHGDEEVFSRETQSGIGLLTGLAAVGLAIGGAFAIVFTLSHGRIGPSDPKSLSLWIALIAYVVIVLVPGLKYPANPPATGSPETLGMRTGLFFAMIAISIAAALLALQTARILSTNLRLRSASLIGALCFLVVVAAAYQVLPAFNELPEGFSPDLLWRFRLGSFGTQAILWAVIGIAFGFAAERVLTPPVKRAR